MANPVIEWAKDNPLLAAGAALAIVAVVLVVTGGGSSADEGGTGGQGAAGVQAYYAAVANQAQAGAVIQTAQIKANSETNRALIAATYGLEAVKVTSATEQGRTAAGVSVANIQNETARYGIASSERVSLARIDADIQNNRGQVDIARIAAANAQQELTQRYQIANLATTARLGKAQRGAVFQAAITGQIAPVVYKPVNPGNSAAAIIGATGKAVEQIGGTIIPFF